LIDFSLIDNILFGDAESMKKSSGGHDTIEFGNNFKNNLTLVETKIYSVITIIMKIV
jgi:hypothetical protein